jgi:SulP family sulfate permease
VLTQENDEGGESITSPVHIPEGVMVFEMNGALFFGAAERFTATISAVQDFPKVLILRMSEVFAIDASGLKMLKDVHHRLTTHGSTLILSEIHSQPYLAAEKAGLLNLIGEQNLCHSIEEALATAERLLIVEKTQA